MKKKAGFTPVLLIQLAIFLRRFTGFLLKQPAEIMGIVEPEGVGNTTYGVGGLQQQMFGLFHQKVVDMVLGRPPGFFGE